MLAQFEWLHGHIEAARAGFVSAFEIYRRVVDDLFTAMTERERSLYWGAVRALFDIFATFAVEVAADSTPVLGDLYDLLLFHRGLMIDSVVTMRSAIVRSGDPEVRATFDAWLAKRRELASYLTVRGAARSAGMDLLQLREQVEALEKRLVEQTRPFLPETGRQSRNWREIRSRLEPGSAAVEIVRASLGRKSSSGKPEYLALVLRPDFAGGPRIVDLGPAAYLEDAALRRYRDGLDAISKASFDDYWGALAGELQGVTRIYLSPEGVYSIIDWNTLYDGEAFLIDRVDLRPVTSTRDLLDAGQRSAPRRAAALFGRPAYRPALGTMTAVAGAAGQDAVRPAPSFRDLPGTATEVLELEALLRNHGWTVEAHTGERASRATLESVRGPGLLHIATHGFFLDPHETEVRTASGVYTIVAESDPEREPGARAFEQALRGAGGEVTPALMDSHSADESLLVFDPLFRSGLALAGASLRPGEEGEDGLFTAYDAAGLLLDGTELVVLSACESGRGIPRPGEGAIGLVRALRAAGAGFTLTTLWPVDDGIARELMGDFYRRWLGGTDLRDSLRQAVLTLKQRYTIPLLWGGYILAGR
jgi:CHAT domain-containing protein